MWYETELATVDMEKLICLEVGTHDDYDDCILIARYGVEKEAYVVLYHGEKDACHAVRSKMRSRKMISVKE